MTFSTTPLVAVCISCLLVSVSAVCEDILTCESCVSGDGECRWCANLSACALADNYIIDGVPSNCTEEVINSTGKCLSVSTIQNPTVCEVSLNCESCVSTDDECRWCANLSACALMDNFIIEGVLSNCTEEAINSTDQCLIFSTIQNPTTEKKLKCKAARAALPEEECDEEVWTEDDKHGYVVLIALPILGGLFGVISFFIMVFVWLRFCYHPAKRSNRDDSPEGTTLTTCTDDTKHEYERNS